MISSKDNIKENLNLVSKKWNSATAYNNLHDGQAA